MKIKYYKKVQRRDGSINHFIAVPLYVESATGLKSRSCDTLAEAKAYSFEVQSKYATHARDSRKQRKLVASSVRGLVDFYRSTEDFQNLSESSVRSYQLMSRTALETVLPGARLALGDMKATDVTKDVVRQFIQVVREQYSHHRAVHCVKVMRLVWSTAENHDKITGNPWRKPKLKSTPKREILWTHGQVERFIAAADELGLHSMGTMALMCYSMCQRPSDIRNMLWKHLDNGFFEFRQQKTGTEVYVPLVGVLAERLKDIADKNYREDNPDDHILKYEVTGKPYTQWDYAKLARKIKKHAGLPDSLKIGDLRRTGTTRLANSGCTEDELMSVTGHKSREIISTYVKRSRETAAGAMRKAWQ